MTELDMLLFEGLMHNPRSTHIFSREKNYEGYFDREKTTKRGDRILRELEFPLNVLENELKGTKWLGGDHFTVTDLNVASVAYWIHFQGHERRDKILRKIPHTKAWLDRCMKRRHSPLSVLSKTSVGEWDWDVLQEGASKRCSRAGDVSFMRGKL
jgi:glutathione S-transferase